MQSITINGKTGLSKIMVGETLEHLPGYIPAGVRPVIITDANLLHHYWRALPPCDIIETAPGEKHKTLETMEYIYYRLTELETDRSGFIVGFGGGIVCDMAGFAAATYKRGLRFGFVSTTLLSQVDASVGGKNGVNFQGYKNMIGTFHQPEFVICDPRMLDTLPGRELVSGMAEVVKHAVLAGREMFSYLETQGERALALDHCVLEQLIADSVRLKAGVVNADEHEHGERRKLNLGHTLGHALEKNYPLTHGEAVSIGMVFAARLSVKMGLMTAANAARLSALLSALKLPVSFDFDRNKILDALRLDKKREGADIHFVLPVEPGRVEIRAIPVRALEEALDDMP